MGNRISSDRVLSGLRRGQSRCTLGGMLKFLDPSFEPESELDEILRYMLQHLLRFYVLLDVDQMQRVGFLLRDDLDRFMMEYINSGERAFPHIRRECLERFVVGEEVVATSSSTTRPPGGGGAGVPQQDRDGEDHDDPYVIQCVSQLIEFANGGRGLETTTRENLAASEVENMYRLMARDGLDGVCNLAEFLKVLEIEESVTPKGGATPSNAGQMNHQSSEDLDDDDEDDDPRCYSRDKLEKFLYRYLRNIRTSPFFEDVVTCEDIAANSSTNPSSTTKHGHGRVPFSDDEITHCSSGLVIN
ncbi:unnamed protein product [Amoebophrya sp. A25]|nr:unnamed protein product [Amoebophrya sp. A25]|eukprot:GSA25T00005020001.1